MVTDKKTQYDLDEDKFVEVASKLKENYNINNKDLLDIIWDRC